MNLPPEAKAILDWWWPRAREVLAGHWRVVFLCGGVAQDDFCPGWSDVDICILLDPSRTVRHVRQLAALDEEMRERFVHAGEGGWRNTQILEAKYSGVDGRTLAPFDRLQVIRFGVQLAGPITSIEPPTRGELAGDAQWLLEDLARAPADFSPIRLAGLLQEAARQIVFWRDGVYVSKTAALESEIARGGHPHLDEAYRLALALRREGSAACTRHTSALRRHHESLAPTLHALLAEYVNQPGT